MRKSIYASALLALCAIATAQDTVNFARTYKVGDVDKYRMTMEMGGGQAMTMAMQITQTVKKVYDNGDADVESGTTDMKVVMNGQELPTGSLGNMPKTMMKMNKFGVPVTMPNGGGPMGILRSPLVFPDRGVKVGETVPTNLTDPKNPKQKTTGTFKVVSVADGIATVVCDMTVITAASDKPITAHSTLLFDTAVSKLKSMDGELTGMPKGAGVMFDKVTYKMVRLTN